MIGIDVESFEGHDAKYLLIGMEILEVIDKKTIDLEKWCGYIYITKNLITGQLYVGMKVFDQQVIGSWVQYLGSSKYLNDDILEYGHYNFANYIIDLSDSLESLREKERFYIEKFEARTSDLFYNRETKGIGSRATLYYKFHLYDSINNEELCFANIKECLDFLEMSEGDFRYFLINNIAIKDRYLFTLPNGEKRAEQFIKALISNGRESTNSKVETVGTEDKSIDKVEHIDYQKQSVNKDDLEFEDERVLWTGDSCKQCYLVDLNFNILKTFASIAQARRFCGVKFNDYIDINAFSFSYIQSKEIYKDKYYFVLQTEYEELQLGA